MRLSLELSEGTAARLRERTADSEFDSIESYVEFVLAEVTSSRPELGEPSSRDPEREKEVHERLQSLGYLE